MGRRRYIIQYNVVLAYLLTIFALMLSAAWSRTYRSKFIIGRQHGRFPQMVTPHSSQYDNFRFLFGVCEKFKFEKNHKII